MCSLFYIRLDRWSDGQVPVPCRKYSPMVHGVLMMPGRSACLGWHLYHVWLILWVAPLSHSSVHMMRYKSLFCRRCSYRNEEVS